MWEYEIAEQRMAERRAVAERYRLARSIRSDLRARHPAPVAPVAPVARSVATAPEVGCRRAAAFSGGRA